MSHRYQNRGRGSALVVLTLIAATTLYSQGWSASAIFNAIAIGLIVLVAIYICFIVLLLDSFMLSCN